jgi:hypothetical protein
VTFWAGDEGNKFIQLQSFALSGLDGIQIPYSGSQMDPEARFFPDAGNHFIRIGNGFYSYYHFYFSLITLPFYQIAGFPGIYFIPLIFSFICFLLTAWLTRIFYQEKSTIAVLLLALSTPFLFYTITFWEHTFAVALTTASLLLVLKPPAPSAMRCFLAGGLVGISTVFREEGYVFFGAAVLAAFIVYRRRYRLILHAVGGWLLFLLPLFVFQHQLYGHPLGAHALMNPSPLLEFFKTAQPKYFLDILSNHFIFLFEYHAHPFLKIVLVVPHVLIFLCGFLYPRKKLLLFLLGSACITNFILFMELVRNPEPVWNTLYTQGLIPGTAFALIPFALGRSLIFADNSGLRFLMILLLLYLTASCMNLNQTVFGIIWGPRHFLPVMPVLVTITIAALHHIRTNPDWSKWKNVTLRIAAILILTSFLIQVFGLVTMYHKRAASARLKDAIRQSTSRVVVTDAYWIPEELAPLFFEKQFHIVKSEQELKQLIELLKKTGYREFLFVRSRKYRKLPESSMHLLLQLAVKRDLLIFPGVALMDAALLHCDLQKGL